MFFFEGKIELYTALYLFVIPIGIVLLMLFTKRKYLWTAPITALLLGLCLTTVFYPYYFTDLLKENNEVGGGGYWLMFVFPAHCIVSVITTAICYVINGFKARKK